MRHSSHKREQNTFICASLQVINTTLNVNRDNTQKSCCIIRGFEEEGKTRRKTILWSHTRTGWTDLRQKAFWRAVLERAGPRKDQERWWKQRARGWWDERLPRWNHQSKLPTHTFSSNSERRTRLPLKLARTLYGMLIRVKLARPLPADRTRLDVLNKRADYTTWFMDHAEQGTSVFVLTNGATTFGRPEVTVERGRERAYRQVWRHLTVTMVISLINWLACVFLRSCWRNECCAFRQLPRTGEDKFDPDEGVIFVNDGGPAHRNPNLKRSPPTVLSSTSTAVWKRRSRPTCRV